MNPTLRRDLWTGKISFVATAVCFVLVQPF